MARRRGPAAPVKVGRRDPSLLVQDTAKIDAAAKGQVYLVGARPLRVQGVELPPGCEVPGAASWPRVEAWVIARRIRPATAGEEYTTFEEHLATLAPPEPPEEPEEEPEPAEEQPAPEE